MFGEHLRQARIDAGMSQERLALEAEMDRTYLRHEVTGRVSDLSNQMNLVRTRTEELSSAVLELKTQFKARCDLEMETALQDCRRQLAHEIARRKEIETSLSWRLTAPVRSILRRFW